MASLDDPSPFFAHAARVRADFLGLTLSEADTRTHLIDPVVAMLGYTGLADVRREERIAATREAVDYVLLIDGQRHALIEAKGVQHDITAGHAAQCVQYATVLGVRWCMITNGVIWALYDARGDGSLEQKHVATGRLDRDDVDTTAEAWHVICVLARDPAVADRARRSVLIETEIGAQLSEPDSPAIRALQRAVKRRFGEAAPRDAIAAVIAGWRHSRRTAAVSPAAAPPAEPVPPAEPALARQRSESDRITLSDLVDAGLLPHDAALEHRLRGEVHAAQLRDGLIEYGGQRLTPAQAVFAVQGLRRNGWQYWHYEGVRLSVLKKRFRAERREAKP